MDIGSPTVSGRFLRCYKLLEIERGEFAAHDTFVLTGSDRERWLPAGSQPCGSAAPVARHPRPATRGLPPIACDPARMRVRWTHPAPRPPAILPPVPAMVAVRPGMPRTGRGPYDFSLWRRRRNPYIHRGMRRERRNA